MVSNDDASDEPAPSRRTVLKAVGAGAATVAAPSLAGVASADEAEVQRRKRAEYADPDSARAALVDHGRETLVELADRGFLAEPSLSAFRTDEILTGDVDAGAEGIEVTAERTEAGPTAHVVATTTVDGRTIRLVVRPEAGESFAVLDPVDGEEVILEPEAGVTSKCLFKTNRCRYDPCGVCLGTMYKVCCSRRKGCRTLYSLGDCCGRKDGC